MDIYTSVFMGAKKLISKKKKTDHVSLERVGNGGKVVNKCHQIGGIVSDVLLHGRIIVIDSCSLFQSNSRKDSERPQYLRV